MKLDRLVYIKDHLYLDVYFGSRYLRKFILYQLINVVPQFCFFFVFFCGLLHTVIFLFYYLFEKQKQIINFQPSFHSFCLHTASFGYRSSGFIIWVNMNNIIFFTFQKVGAPLSDREIELVAKRLARKGQISYR